MDGSGFIAAWVAGFSFGFALHRFRAAGPATVPQEGPDRVAGFSENLGGLLASLSLLVFGAVLLGRVVAVTVGLSVLRYEGTPVPEAAQRRRITARSRCTPCGLVCRAVAGLRHP